MREDAATICLWCAPSGTMVASQRSKMLSQLRARLSEALKEGLKAKDETRTATVRLILAGIKDRDIAARPSGNSTGISDEEILNFLQSAIRQRQESISMFQQGGRADLVTKEQAEIDVIKTFLPKQFTDAEIADLARTEIAAAGAASVKDMGKVMTAMRTKYAGQMDLGKASSIVKGLLG